jgi:hypothetical protein
MRLRIAFFAAMIAVGAHAQPQEEIKVGTVLQKCRAAVNWVDLSLVSRGFTIAGTAQAAGMESDWTLIFEPNAKFVDQIEGTGAGRKWLSIGGFDGKTYWHRDWNGLTYVRDLADKEEDEIFHIMRSYRWLDKDEPLEFTLDPAATNETSVVLNWKKRFGLMSGKLAVDRKTWLAKEFERNTSAGPEKLAFSDYRQVEVQVENRMRKFVYPFTWVRSAAGMSDTYRIQELKVRGEYPGDPFRYAPQPIPVEAVAADPKVESKWVRAGLVLVHPKVKGKDVGWFILDSGAGSMIIDTKAAKEAGLASFGQVATVGVSGTEKATWYRVPSFEIGEVRLNDVAMAGIDLGMVSVALGVKCAGICGWDLFSRSVIEMDVAGHEIAIHAPDKFKSDSLKWTPLRFSDNLPVIECKFEDKVGLFRLDTGAAASVTFHSPAVKNLKLLEGRETKKAMLGGVGGLSQAEMGTLTWFEVAGHRFEKPNATFAISDKGPFADPFLIGNVGQDFFKPFRIVLDYPRSRIAFEEK